MTPNEFKEIIDSALNQASWIKWWHLLLWMILSAIGGYLGSFINEKGKNLATKEDIGRITNEIEKVKSIYTKEIEAMREKQQLKLSTVEKRLEAHQGAFRLWYDLMWSLNDDEKRAVQAEKCENWWVDNLFYLDKKSSDAFKRAASVANTFGEYKARDKDAAVERKKAFREMHKVGNYLREGIGLPHLEDEGEWESKILGDD